METSILGQATWSSIAYIYKGDLTAHTGQQPKRVLDSLFSKE